MRQSTALSLITYHLSLLAKLISHPKPWRYLAGHFFWRTGLGSWFTFPFRSFRLHLFPTNLSWQFWVEPQARAEQFDLIKQLLHPGETMIDVGANIGAVTLEAANAVGPEGKIISIEPHPRIFRYLQANLKLNRINHVVCHAVAVGAETSEGCLTDNRRDDMNHLLNTSHLQSVKVPIMTLDEMFQDLPFCDLLKLDVEGREIECLRGAPKLLGRCRNILVEADDSNSTRFGHDSKGLLQLLQDHGFSVYTINGIQMSPVDDSTLTDQISDWVARKELAKVMSNRSQADQQD